MTPERLQQIEDLYQAALHHGPSERAALLQASDPEIRTRVERMLAMESSGMILDRRAADFLDEPTATTVATGLSLGPYHIESQIGVGGMGAVYRAVDRRLGRTVAIKIANARYNERFEREARAISALNHPHICTLHDVGPNYLVMELLDGSTLADEIKKGPLELSRVARYGAQIASALAEAHAHEIVHRDLKPGNVMVTRYGLKVLDFGLAKMFSEPGVTETNAVMGTPAYMAPEQVDGRECDARTDLFALGLILYEMAVGKLPFPGASLGRMLTSGSNIPVPPPSHERGAIIPASLDGLVAKLLEKNPSQRPQSAAEVARELTALADRLDAPPPPVVPTGLRPIYNIPASIALLVLIVAGAWFYHRSERQHWAREQAIPEIARLDAEQKSVAAFLLLQKAEKYIPGDPQLAKIRDANMRLTSIDSSPEGAKVEIQDYLTPGGEWLPLGTTPLEHIRIPSGYFRWKVSKPGAGEFISAPATSSVMQFAAATAPDTQAGMVNIPGGRFTALIDFIGWIACDIPAYDIDKFEVTNRQYQEFVDQGGYKKREYWKEKFVKDGKELSWEQAMDLFRDPTGRPGPSTWEGGHFPPGQAEYPVSGVSWYEASAYAAFVGHSLPAFVQWYNAAPDDMITFTINASNFGKRGPVPVGTTTGIGPYGTYDMAGNVREWSLNPFVSDRHFILGGAWNTQTYLAYDPEALPPFDRSPLNGIRTVRNRVPLPAALATPIVGFSRDFSKAKPASDEIFRVYKTMYGYDQRERSLNPQSAGIVGNTADWTKEKIVIDAGYEAERLTVYLFLPKNVRPPFQAVLFFPSARVNTIPDNRDLGDLQFIDYVIKSGRAVLYPIYQGTYGRGSNRHLPGTRDDREQVIQQSKEVRRSVDFLETRPDIDAAKLAYLGVSQGSAMGVIYTALEDRFKTIVFLDGGFFLGPAMNGRDQVDFAPRIKKPVLMVNGRYDFTFSLDRSQLPLFRMLGTPEADKKHVVFDTPHDISQQTGELAKTVLAWLDKYLGRVN